MLLCSGHSVFADFPEARKIVGAGAMRKTVKDFVLSIYACICLNNIE